MGVGGDKLHFGKILAHAGVGGITLSDAGGDVMLTASGVSATLSGVSYATAHAMGDQVFIDQMFANGNLQVL